VEKKEAAQSLLLFYSELFRNLDLVLLLCYKEQLFLDAYIKLLFTKQVAKTEGILAQVATESGILLDFYTGFKNSEMLYLKAKARFKTKNNAFL